MADRAQLILRNAIQQGLTLCLDSNCLMYYFSGQQPWQTNLHPIFEAKDQGRIQLVTSSVTLAEVLARAQNPTHESQLLNTIRRYFDIIPVLDRTGVDAARIRQSTDLSVRTPDALEMATATQMSATLFITNDERLIRAPLPGSRALYLKDLVLDWLEEEFDACIDVSQPVVSLPSGPTTLNLDLMIDHTQPLSQLQTPVAAVDFPLFGLKLSQMVAGPAALVGLVETSTTEADKVLAIGLLPSGHLWEERYDQYGYVPGGFCNTLVERVRRMNQSKEGKREPERYTLYLLADISKLAAEESVNKMDNNGQMLPHRKRSELWRRYLAPFRPLARLWPLENTRLWRGEAGNAHPLNLTQFHPFLQHAQTVLGNQV